MAKTESSRKLVTVERSLEVVEAIQKLGGASVSELSEYLELPPSTVHGYVSTLEQNHYLTRNDDGYDIGLKFLNIGGYVTTRNEGYEFTKQKVKELAKITGERAQFIVEEFGKGVYLHTETEKPAVQIDARIGKIKHLHASAAGKAILSTFGQDRIDKIIDTWGLPSFTQNTITSRSKLVEELEEVSNLGYSINREESVKGLHAMGVPILHPNGECLGGISVSVPSERFRGEDYSEELPPKLLGVANDIELQLAYP